MCSLVAGVPSALRLPLRAPSAYRRPSCQNHRLVMRDSTGRIFQERRHLVPNGQEPELARLEITDLLHAERSTDLIEP